MSDIRRGDAEQQAHLLVIAAAVDMLLSDTDGQANAAEIAFRKNGKRSGFWSVVIDTTEEVFDNLGDGWDEVYEIDIAEVVVKRICDQHLHPAVDLPVSEYVDRLYWPQDDSGSVRV